MHRARQGRARPWLLASLASLLVAACSAMLSGVALVVLVGAVRAGRRAEVGR